MASATVKARIRFADTATLLYSTDPGLASPSSVEGVEGEDNVFTFTLTGLAADTQYYYGIEGLFTGQFKTWPTGQSSFVVAASGDAGDTSRQYPGPLNTSNSPAYDHIRARNPALFIYLGDLNYRNLNTTSVSTYWDSYKAVLGNERVGSLFRSVPTAYIWDDHDFGPNNSDGTYSGKSAAASAYREYVPHWDLPDAGAIYQTFSIGRVRFILLDCRYARSPNGNTDNSSKTRLGATQKQWLKDTLLAATEPVIVVNVMSWIGDTTGFDDGWELFSTERTELFDFFTDNDLMGRLLLIGADIHELITDDGTNTNFATGASDPGPPYFGFAPLDAAFNDFSATAQHKYQTRRQQYGTLTFTDNGTSIDVLVQGWAVTNASEAEVFSVELSYAATAEPEPEPTPLPPATSGGFVRPRRRIHIEPPAEIEEITDDGWIHILL